MSDMSDATKLIIDVRFDLYNFQSTTEANVESLITTIESLQAEVKKHKWEDEQFSWLQEQVKVCSCENKQLKAITELAVKGLKWYADDNNYSYDSVNAPNCLADNGYKAKEFLSEIERIQNAQT